MQNKNLSLKCLAKHQPEHLVKHFLQFAQMLTCVLQQPLLLDMKWLVLSRPLPLNSKLCVGVSGAENECMNVQVLQWVEL